MKHHVTPETALKLKEAGYPQPETTEGIFADGFGHIVKDPYCDTDSLAYMPTATEILEQFEMFGVYDMCFDFYKSSWAVGMAGAFFKSEDENPAEAAAMEYLKVKQQ